MDSDQRRPRVPRCMQFVLAALVTTLAMAVLNPLGALAKPPADGAGYARIKSVCGAPEPGDASCFALVRQPVAAAESSARGVHRFKLSDGAASAGPAGGLTPSDLASAYGYEPSVGGSGQTLAIVDAFDDPNIESDLGEFDSHYGLPACTAANKCFEKVNQEGSAAPLPGVDETGWSAEMALDVESAHATCQNCTILLVETRNNSLANLAVGVHEAVTLGADEVSNSYGGPEAGTFGEAADYNDPGRVILAASGDWGYNGWLAPEFFEAPNLPAALPSVVSVGGTTLALDEVGKRLTETVWNGNGPENEFEFEEGASGGGCSISWSAPPWQQSTAGFPATGCGTKRSAVDVSADADPLTGFDIFDSYECGKKCEEIKRGKNWITIGGTSLSTPVVAGMYALAGGSNGITSPALTLYGHQGDSSLFDVKQGGNGFCDDNGAACGIDALFEEFFEEPFRIDCEGTTACNATTGFDGPSGVGAPSSLNLFKPLAPVGAITPPGKARAGAPAGFSAATTSDPYPGGEVTAGYAWSWGDGTESSGQTPTHTFSASGEYTVTMTYTDRYGVKAAPVSVKVVVAERTVKEIEEEAAAKKKAEEEIAKTKAEEEVEKKAEQEALSRKASEELASRMAEEASRARAAEEAARRAAETAAGSGQGGVAVFKSSADPDATLAGLGLQASASGALTLKISCPAGESSCEGTVTVRTATAVPASARARVLALASASFKIAGGKTAVVKLHLSARARALLAHKHRLRVRVTIAAHDPAGASHSSVATATLRRRS
jgi:PKD repeat protein